jgi:hypothetical protein
MEVVGDMEPNIIDDKPNILEAIRDKFFPVIQDLTIRIRQIYAFKTDKYHRFDSVTVKIEPLTHAHRYGMKTLALSYMLHACTSDMQ